MTGPSALHAAPKPAAAQPDKKDKQEKQEKKQAPDNAGAAAYHARHWTEASAASPAPSPVALSPGSRMTGSPRAKDNALEANKKSWGIGNDAVALSPGSRMTGSPRAKENALQANKKNWGIGGDAPAAAPSAKKEEEREKVPEPKAAAAAPAAEGEVRMVWRQGYYNDKNVWQRGSYEVCACVYVCPYPCLFSWGDCTQDKRLRIKGYDERQMPRRWRVSAMRKNHRGSTTWPPVKGLACSSLQSMACSTLQSMHWLAVDYNPCP